jgi:type I restriction enzyme S subunit
LITAKIIKNGRIEKPDEFIAEEDYDNWMSRGIPKAGDIVMTTEAPLGEVAQLDGSKVALAQRVITLRGKDGLLDQTFLKFLLRSQPVQEDLRSRATGTTVIGIRQSELRKIALTFPSIDEQRAIAHILGTIDDKIELNRRMNETLEAIARAIFKSWFVEFDPVRAKVNGEAPESICRRLWLTPDLLALFPNRFVDSELGGIPEGWEISKVAVVTENIFSGGTPDTRKSAYWNGELNWFSSGETRNRFVVGTEKKITQAGVKNSSTRLAVPGDILIASAGQGNTRGQTSYCAICTYVNQSVVSVRSKPGMMHPIWLFYNLSSRYEEMRSISDSHSSRGSLTTKLIGGMPIVHAGSDLVVAFGNLVGSMTSRQIENQREAEILSGIRDNLLPKLLSGGLRAPETVGWADEGSPTPASLRN